MLTHARLAAFLAAATLAAGAAGLSSAFALATPADVLKFEPREGFSRTLGSKQAVGYFERSSGRCAVTLMVAEAFDEAKPDAPPSAARLTVSLVPGQPFGLESAEAQSMTIVCGPGAETVSVETAPATM